MITSMEASPAEANPMPLTRYCHDGDGVEPVSIEPPTRRATKVRTKATGSAARNPVQCSHHGTWRRTIQPPEHEAVCDELDPVRDQIAKRRDEDALGHGVGEDVNAGKGGEGAENVKRYDEKYRGPEVHRGGTVDHRQPPAFPGEVEDHQDDEQ